MKVKAIGRVWVEVRNKDGKLLLKRYCGQNLITSVGKAAMAGLVGNTGAVTAFTYLAIGTSSTAVAIGDTTLGAELSTLGLSRTAATVSRVTTTVSNDTLQFVYTWTATGSTTVNEAGVFNASSSGTMLAHKLTGAIALDNTDTLALTYKIQFS